VSRAAKKAAKLKPANMKWVGVLFIIENSMIVPFAYVRLIRFTRGGLPPLAMVKL
jgi:hypothetical protein